MLDLRFAVNKPIDIVYDYLTDMQKFASVHPVIARIDPVGGNSYLVHETLRFGFFPFSFSYPTTVDGDFTGRRVSMKATVMKLTTIEMHYALHADSNHSTTVHETILFKSPLPTEAFLGSLFREQHGILFRNIEALK